VDHPDVPLPIDGDAADLAEDPVVGQLLRQDASTAKVGISPAEAVREGEKMPSDTALAIKSKKLREKRATASGD
jgi:hypothetical protein